MPKPEPVEAEWWRARQLGVRPDEILDKLVRQIEDDQASRYAAYREYARLVGADPDMFGDPDAFAILSSDTVSQNELANTLETLHAQVFKNKVVPAVSCSEANWEEYQRGKAYSRWLEGVFDKAETNYDAVPRSGWDGLVYGTGFIKIGHDYDDYENLYITHTRVDPRYITVDRLEARGGKPRSLFQKDFVDKFKLAEDYAGTDKAFYVPEGKTAKEAAAERVETILDSKSNDDVDMALGSRVKCEMVTVREAWHLPSSKSAKDGRHVIWIRGCTLVDEEWTWKRFPFARIKFGHPLSGFYGDSAVKRLAPTQKSYDELNAKIQEAQRIMGVPRIIAQVGSGIHKEDIDDVPGGILMVNMPPAQAIQEWNATAVAPELYQERADAPRKMRSLLGVSDFEVQNQLPQSMREISGPALERWVDSGTARHAQYHDELAHLVTDLAYLSLDYAAELEKEGKRVVVQAPGAYEKSSIEELDFTEVKVDRSRMKLRVQPMGEFPQTFAGKVDAFGKLRETGDIDSKRYLRMLNIPDYDGEIDYLTSSEDIIMKNVCLMLKKGKYIPPLPNDNLDMIPPLVTAFINHYRTKEDCDQNKVGMLNQYIQAALSLKAGLGASDPNAPPPPRPIDPMTGQPVPLGAPPPMDPMAGGMPPMPGAPPGMPPMPMPGGPPMAPPPMM